MNDLSFQYSIDQRDEFVTLLSEGEEKENNQENMFFQSINVASSLHSDNIGELAEQKLDEVKSVNGDHSSSYLTEDLDSHSNELKNNLKIIEEYSNNLMKMERKLNESAHYRKLFKEKQENAQTELSKNSATSTKVKYKNVETLKKDVVIKKLLKTIEVMNQELNKRDQLIVNMEKENSILSEKQPRNKQQKEETDSFKTNKEAYLSVEVNRLKQQLTNEKSENDSLKNRISLLEKQLKQTSKLDDDSKSFMPEYKEIAASSKPIDQEKVFKLEKENRELTDLNKMLKKELDKLSKQVELIEKKKSLECEINEKFEELLEQKFNLDLENKNLMAKIDVLKEEMRIQLITCEEQLSESTRRFQNELIDFKRMSTEKEAKYSSIISNYEMQLVESNDAVRKLSEERTFLVNTLNELQLERDTLGHQLSSESTHLERKLDCLGKENERMRKSMQSLNDLCGEQQRKIKELSKCLDERCSSNEKQSQKKTEELKRLRQSLNLSQEKVKYWQLKHQTDLEELKKSKEKELETIKSNNDQLTNRNGELSRSNSELRKKVQQLENDIKELNEKLNMSKHSLEAANKHKKELKEELDRSSFNYKKEINVLEQLRDEYIKKNTCQQQSIEQMLEQINKFKDDLEELIKRNQTLNEKIVKLNSNCEAYKKKYSEIKFYLKKVLSEENISLFNQSTDQIEKAKQPSEIDSKQMNVLGKLLNELNLNGANLDNNQEEPSK